MRDCLRLQRDGARLDSTVRKSAQADCGLSGTQTGNEARLSQPSGLLNLQKIYWLGFFLNAA